MRQLRLRGYKPAQIDSMGTSLQGFLKGVSYEYLVSVLGSPVSYSDAKSRVQWRFKHGEVVATIYDYKDQKTDVLQLREWHIGGNSSWALDLVYRELQEGIITDRNGAEPTYCPAR